MIELSLVHPVFAFLLLGIPALWLAGSRKGFAWHRVLRALTFILVILALTQPVLMTSLPKEHHAIIVDQSASLAAAEQAMARDIARTLLDRVEDEGNVSVIQVGGGADSAISDHTIRLAAETQEGSSLGTALELAAQSIPYGLSGSVALVSDGLSTDRHWARAIQQLQERGIPVHTYRLDGTQAPFLANVQAAPVRAGETARIRFDVVGAGQGLEVTLRQDLEVIASAGPFDSDGRASLELEFEAREAGFLDLVLELEVPGVAGDVAGSFNRPLTLAVQEPLRVLYAGERQQGGAGQMAGLLGGGFEVEALPAEGAEAADLSRFDVVLLDDRPSRNLPEAFQQELQRAVRDDGLGLVHSGIEGAFADGGYHETPVGELLPVDLYGKEEKSDPSVGLAIILDTSGSMAGSRIELAKQIARIAIRRMQPHDRIGIVEFYGNKHWAVPMQPASNKIEIDRAIGRMKAIGGTVLYPAVQEAYYGLQNVNTRFKHILLITDAGVEDANYEGMVRRISRENINVSSILVGQGGHNLIMSDIANWGQGRFYSVADQFSLVELILKQPSTRKLPSYHEGLFELDGLGGAGWWGTVDNSDLPPLERYVEVSTRDGAEVLIEERGTGHPVMSSWRYGLGRVTVFMSEPLGLASSQWSNWGQYGEFLGRVIARTAADGNSWSLDLQRRDERLSLAARRLVPAASEPLAWRVDANGRRTGENLAFRETAPGLFETALDLPSAEAARLVVESDGGMLRQRIANAPASDRAPETQVDPMQALDLAALAGLTGGSYLPALDSADWSLSAGSGELSFVVRKLWPWLLLLGLLSYLGELVHRRWPRGND